MLNHNLRLITCCWFCASKNSSSATENWTKNRQKNGSRSHCVTLENEPIGIHTSLRQSHRCLTSDAWRYKQIIQVVVLLSKYVHYPSNESVACRGGPLSRYPPSRRSRCCATSCPAVRNILLNYR